LSEWREDAELRACRADSHLVFANRIIALIGALEDMTREARLSREATEKAVTSRIARHQIERALRAADAPEDSMATDNDLIRYEGHAEAVRIMRDMLGV
jgi:transcriptional/translational regulatory protein YebC/TACO1